VHFDARNFSTKLNAIADRDSASLGDSFEVRRARIGIVGTINKDIAYEIVGNGVGGTTNWIDTAFINYGFNKKAQVRVGRFKQPFSLEELTSSNNIDFMERSYGNQMVPGKRLGAMMHGEPITGFTYGVSVYQDGFNELTNQSSLGTKQAARFTLNLAQMNDMKDTVLHIGAGYTGGDSTVVPTNSGNTQEVAKAETRATILLSLMVSVTRLSAPRYSTVSTRAASLTCADVDGCSPTMISTCSGRIPRKAIVESSECFRQFIGGAPIKPATKRLSGLL
jgi:phosphate-selective porin